MSVTPNMIAVALGQAAPEPDSIQDQQWSLWIDDAYMLLILVGMVLIRRLRLIRQSLITWCVRLSWLT